MEHSICTTCKWVDMVNEEGKSYLVCTLHVFKARCPEEEIMTIVNDVRECVDYEEKNK